MLAERADRQAMDPRWHDETPLGCRAFRYLMRRRIWRNTASPTRRLPCP